MSNVNVERVAAYAADRIMGGHPGFTLTLSGQEVSGIGYAVGGNPECPEKSVRLPSITVGDMRRAERAIKIYARRVERKGQRYVGGWRDSGRLYLDSPTILLDREAAIALGRERGERAIYDIENCEEIRLSAGE